MNPHIDDSVDRLIGLREACGLSDWIPPGCHPATMTRWINRGVPLPNGTREKLKARRVGSKWMTTRGWVKEFVEAQTAAFLGHPAGPRSLAEAARASSAAEAELERMGA